MGTRAIKKDRRRLKIAVAAAGVLVAGSALTGVQVLSSSDERATARASAHLPLAVEAPKDATVTFAAGSVQDVWAYAVAQMPSASGLAHLNAPAGLANVGYAEVIVDGIEQVGDRPQATGVLLLPGFTDPQKLTEWLAGPRQSQDYVDVAVTDTGVAVLTGLYGASQRVIDLAEEQGGLAADPVFARGVSTGEGYWFNPKTAVAALRHTAFGDGGADLVDRAFGSSLGVGRASKLRITGDQLAVAGNTFTVTGRVHGADQDGWLGGNLLQGSALLAQPYAELDPDDSMPLHLKTEPSEAMAGFDPLAAVAGFHMLSAMVMESDKEQSSGAVTLLEEPVVEQVIPQHGRAPLSLMFDPDYVVAAQNNGMAIVQNVQAVGFTFAGGEDVTVRYALAPEPWAEKAFDPSAVAPEGDPGMPAPRDPSEPPAFPEVFVTAPPIGR